MAGTLECLTSYTGVLEEAAGRAGAAHAPWCQDGASGWSGEQLGKERGGGGKGEKGCQGGQGEESKERGRAGRGGKVGRRGGGAGKE